MMNDTVTETQQAGAAVTALMSGDVFVPLAMDRADQRAAALEAVLGRCADEATRVVWVGNPLRSALTMERFLLQIAGPEIDLRIERGPAELARVLAQPAGLEGRLLVIVQQPETINPETLESLGSLAAHLGEQTVQVQFLLVGSPALRLPRVPHAALQPLLPLPPVDAPAPAAAPRARLGDILPVIVLLLLAAMGVALALTASEPRSPASQTQAAAAPIVPAAQIDVDQLRHQFDAFLAERTTSLPKLSDAQKDALFDQFLTRHRRE